MRKTWERGREGKVECGGKREITWWEAEGGGWPTAEKEREGRAHRGQKERDEELCGGVCTDLEHVVARCRLRPKIEPFFFCFPSSSSAPLLSEKRERFLRGKFTAGHRAGRGSGSSPEMNRGGSFRRRLSSLRGAWRWSTGYLFRKVGCNEWWIWLKAALVASSLSTLNVFFLLCHRKSFCLLRRLLQAPNVFSLPPPLPPLLPHSFSDG